MWDFRRDSLTGWLAYLETLHPKAIAMGLERVRAVYERLEVRLAFPVFTVAGTNGKGSTCALLERMLRSGCQALAGAAVTVPVLV